MRITPFQLDTYAAEFEEQVKAANAHRREVEALRLVNRNLAARVKSLEDELTSINAEHVELVKVSPLWVACARAVLTLCLDSQTVVMAKVSAVLTARCAAADGSPHPCSLQKRRWQKR